MHVHKECYLLEEAQEDVQKERFHCEQVDILYSIQKPGALLVKPTAIECIVMTSHEQRLIIKENILNSLGFSAYRVKFVLLCYVDMMSYYIRK